MAKFYNAVVLGRGEFVNGTRLVYPMADKAMRHLITSSPTRLCCDLLLPAEPALHRHAVRHQGVDYDAMVAHHGYFGDFDPFGDFDLPLGAATLNLKIVEMPIRYVDRTYGETQISRFRHGWLLVRMVAFGWRKFKAL